MLMNDANSFPLARLRLLSNARDDKRETQAEPTICVDSSEDILLERIVSGSDEGLAILFRRYARVVHSLGRRILRDNTEADDLVQEVFLYIQRRACLFDSTKSSARSWIFQVAYTQAFLRRRQLKAHGFYLSGITDNARETGIQVNSGADYDQTVEGLFGRTGWRKMFLSLSQEQQETLRLHFFEGYTFAEIAERLGQSYSNVRNHHYRGLEKLRKYLTENPLNPR
jgi:RNA polymerase sigma-70 factor, ECF subfamily